MIFSSQRMQLIELKRRIDAAERHLSGIKLSLNPAKHKIIYL